MSSEGVRALGQGCQGELLRSLEIANADSLTGLLHQFLELDRTHGTPCSGGNSRPIMIAPSDGLRPHTSMTCFGSLRQLQPNRLHHRLRLAANRVRPARLPGQVDVLLRLAVLLPCVSHLHWLEAPVRLAVVGVDAE